MDFPSATNVNQWLKLESKLKLYIKINPFFLPPKISALPAGGWRESHSGSEPEHNWKRRLKHKQVKNGWAPPARAEGHFREEGCKTLRIWWRRKLERKRRKREEVGDCRVLDQNWCCCWWCWCWRLLDMKGFEWCPSSSSPLSLRLLVISPLLQRIWWNENGNKMGSISEGFSLKWGHVGIGLTSSSLISLAQSKNLEPIVE